MEKQKKVLPEDALKTTSNLSGEMNFIDPKKIIDTLEISAGMSVGDFGAGTGYFSFPLAKKVGSSGRVYSLDILKEKLEAIESQAKVLGLSNISTKRVNLEMIEGSKLQAESLDWVCLVNILFQNKDKTLVIKEAVRTLKKGGKVLIIDWNAKNFSFGPASELRIAQKEFPALASNCGLNFLKEIEISNLHYGVILEK